MTYAYKDQADGIKLDSVHVVKPTSIILDHQRYALHLVFGDQVFRAPLTQGDSPKEVAKYLRQLVDLLDPPESNTVEGETTKEKPDA